MWDSFIVAALFAQTYIADVLDLPDSVIKYIHTSVVIPEILTNFTIINATIDKALNVYQPIQNHLTNSCA